MVRPGVNKFNDRSYWGIPYLGENKYTGMIRFSLVLRSAHFPKNIWCSFGVRYSEILPKHCHSFSGVLTKFERPLCCVHVRDFESSLLMSPAINLAFGEVSRMLSQFHNNQRSLDGKPRERSESWLVVDTFAHKYSYSLPLTSIFFAFQSSLHKIATPPPLCLARSAFEAFFLLLFKNIPSRVTSALSISLRSHVSDKQQRSI